MKSVSSSCYDNAVKRESEEGRTKADVREGEYEDEGVVGGYGAEDGEGVVGEGLEEVEEEVKVLHVVGEEKVKVVHVVGDEEVKAMHVVGKRGDKGHCEELVDKLKMEA